MRQPSIVLLIVFIMFLAPLPCNSAIQGGIDYTIPIDYSKLSEQELELKAREFYHNALNAPDGKVTEDVSKALLLYNVLQNVNSDNPSYCIKSGCLYDKLGVDKRAKGNFYKAIGINPTAAEPYFYLGEFYYKREMYRKAMKHYKKAIEKGYDTNYDTLYRLGDICEKFGDTRSALEYLNKASLQNPNPFLDIKIKRIGAQDSVNKGFYRD